MNNIELAEISRIATELDAMCGDDEQLFADMLEGETDLYEIIAHLHDRIALDKELITGITERAKELSDRKGRLTARTDAYKAAIGKYLRAAKLAKIELPEATYSVRDGKPKLAIVDPEAVPPEYQRIKTEPDKTLINQSFADSEALPNWLAWEEATDIVTARAK